MKNLYLKFIIFIFSAVNLYALEPASNPDPANGATKVATNTVLSWTAPSGAATSHLIFIGTDAAAVTSAGILDGDWDLNGKVDYNDLYILSNNWLNVKDGNYVNLIDYSKLTNNWALQSSQEFKGSVTQTNFSPQLETRKTYYWRVDEVNGNEIQKGSVWSFITVDSNYSIVGKVMCGYQGWFNTPGDGTTRGWVHWLKSGNSSFTPTNCHVDLWPDMSEMTADEKVEATDFYDGTNHYYVFSSHNHNLVMRHFSWMQQYGIDGIYLQRFAKEIKDQGSASFFHRNDVLDYCKEGANTYGRAYAIMYDLSGLKGGQTSYVINDWKYLVDTKHITKDANDHAYMYHKGKPVVAVWGIGFNDGRQYTLSECLNLVNFFKNDPVYGGCTVVVGVPSNWRTLNGDCLNDPLVTTIVQAADVICPWSVGRYNSGGVSSYASSVWIPDQTWCNTNGKDYLPVIWPGYSYHNADSTKPMNEMPRLGGQFLWTQASSTITAACANMLYVAMFDEVDEGTAIFKVTNNPPRPNGVDMFVTYEGLASDEYLWLTGKIGQALRGEFTMSRTRPPR